MVRPYPLDPDDSNRGRKVNAAGQGTRRAGPGAQLSSLTADAIVALLDLRHRRPDLTHFLGALLLLLVGIVLIASTSLTDQYLHRGVESGAERPYVVQSSGRELATNVDLRIFTPEDIRDVAATLGDAGFGYVRQEFSWAEVETNQGQFNWSLYDPIVEAMNQESIAVIAVIVDAPRWSVAGETVISNNRPPADPDDLQRFVRELTAHYGDQVPYVQIWDRPNLASEWGGRPATGATFQPFLAAGFYGAREGNAAVRVITPELAVLPDVAEGVGDLVFLRGLYSADAEDVFDIVGIALDGGTNSPDDRRVSVERENFSRAILTRELMVRHGDAETPVWATTYGWPVGSEVSREEQAEYVVRGLERAWSEWPWMGLMIQWSFAARAEDPVAKYAVAPGGSSTPLYRRLTDPDLRRRSDIANTGFAPMSAEAVTFEGIWDDQHLEGRTFRTTNQVGSSITLRLQGTGLIAFLRSGPQAGAFRLELDGEVFPGGYGEEEDLWSFFVSFRTDDLPRRLVSGLDDEEHTLRITLMEPGELTLGGFVVEREAPFVWPIILLTTISVIVLFLGLRSMIYLVAIRSGHLQRRADAPFPALPRLPDWQAGRRA